MYIQQIFFVFLKSVRYLIKIFVNFLLTSDHYTSDIRLISFNRCTDFQQGATPCSWLLIDNRIFPMDGNFQLKEGRRSLTLEKTKKSYLFLSSQLQLRIGKLVRFMKSGLICSDRVHLSLQF